ncbi:MAG TPA: hypothetical protein VGH28_31580 [Polyangiaceae bacterium]|jgi:hypothetical protein
MNKLFLFVTVGAALCAAYACGGQTGDGGDAGDAGGGDVAVDVKPDVSQKDGGGPDVAQDADAAPPTDAGPTPPPPPDGGAPTSNVLTFAIQTVSLGEADRAGTPSPSAWKNYGYDVDGLVTTSSDTNVCTLHTGAPKANQADGTGGIDNAWGAVLLPILETAASLPTPSATESAAIDSGIWTMQIQVTGLSDDPQQNALGLSSQIFLSGQYPSGTPAFDMTTDWPVLSTSVVDGQTIASGSTVKFASSYVSNGTFVSGAGPGVLVFTLSFGGAALPITIHDAVLTFDHVDHADAADGTISGVIDTQEFIDTMQVVAGTISQSLCGSAFDGIAEQLRQAQDILQDGTNTAGVSCDGISIGLGFTAKLVANPTTVVQAPPPPPNPCGD